jgi:8-oxo-dGTP pyrophosphatase MutT (NUDIX family)
MNVRNITQVLTVLRARLHPLAAADSLVDVVEGERPQARRAAVLIALFVREGDTHMILIRRASTLRAHSGEIAFPGGSYEAGDGSLVSTALREAYEEIGLAPERVELLGLLPPVFTVVSNFFILPVVASLPAGPGQLLLQPGEVAEVLLLPVHALADPQIAHTEIWTRGGIARPVYFYDYGALRIWGATGRMLNALLQLVTTPLCGLDEQARPGKSFSGDPGPQERGSA